MRWPDKGREALTVAVLVVAVALLTVEDASAASLKHATASTTRVRQTPTRATSIHIDKDEVEAVQFHPSDPNNQAPPNAPPVIIRSNDSWPALPKRFGNRTFVINIPKVDVADEAIGVNGCITCLHNGDPVTAKLEGKVEAIKPFYLVPEPPRKVRKKIQKKIKKRFKKQLKKAKKKLKKIKKKLKKLKKKTKKKPPSSKFYAKIHFEHGRKKFRVFDYASAAKGSEYKIFPDKFVKLLKKKKFKKKFKKGITLYVAGMHSEEGIEKRNNKLAIKRATSAACYVAWYLIRTHKYKHVKLMVGIFKKDPEKGKDGKKKDKEENKAKAAGKPSKTDGKKKSAKPSLFELKSQVLAAKKKKKSSKEHKKQRRVNIFLPSHKHKKHFKFEFKWGWGKYKSKHKSRGDGGLAKTCFKRKALKNWQVKQFKKYWLNYRRP